MLLSEFKSFCFQSLLSKYPKRELDQLFKVWIKDRLKLDDVAFLLAANALIDSQTEAVLMDDLKRLENEEPIQYVLGYCSFYDLVLSCNPNALIPRPETEELVQWILVSCNAPKINLIDLGTGSGCIPLAIKNNRPNWDVTGVDISDEALWLANNNAKTLNLQVHFSAFDITKDPKLFLQSDFDIIVSNPPYIPVRDQLQMSANVLRYEPHLALFVPDENPLYFYSHILSFSQVHLKHRGNLFLEIHEELADDVIHLLAESGFANIELRKDLQGKNRMIKAQLVSLSE